MGIKILAIPLLRAFSSPTANIEELISKQVTYTSLFFIIFKFYFIIIMKD